MVVFWKNNSSQLHGNPMKLFNIKEMNLETKW